MRRSLGRPIPYEFVLEALAEIEPDSYFHTEPHFGEHLELRTKAMFGCTAVYLGPRILLILRERADFVKDNGVWLATSPEHHDSLRREFPSMRSIEIFGPGPSSWQVLPVDAEDFETSVLRAVDLILAGDERIGKVPKPRQPRKKRTTKKKKR